MASPIPKPAATRQRRNRTTTAATLEAAPASFMPLPERDTPWHQFTTWTWQTWWASPMAAEWVDADVPDLFAIIRLVDAFWASPSPDAAAKLHAEIRIACREFGLSPLSRRQLQWEVKKVERATPPAPASQPTRQRDPRLRALA